MPKTSAGILPYRTRSGQLEVLLVHPGGPFWAKKDLGSWSIAKGEYEEGEDPLQAALREFSEETGFRPIGPFLRLAQQKQSSGKLIDAWATESEWNPSAVVSNTFSMEWPKRSGQIREFPEIDRAEWFNISEAMQRIIPGQCGFLDELRRRVSSDT
jgi:predicted NUDIX family NTP pyrophosphohydrolase